MASEGHLSLDIYSFLRFLDFDSLDFLYIPDLFSPSKSASGSWYWFLKFLKQIILLMESCPSDANKKHT